jgi:hypothetical protein
MSNKQLDDLFHLATLYQHRFLGLPARGGLLLAVA